MGRSHKEYTAKEKQEIESAYQRSKQSQEQRRFLCVKLRICNQKSSKEISSIAGYSKSSVDTYIARYHTKGIESLKHTKPSGRPRRMDEAQERSFLSTFEKEAEEGRMLEVSQIHAALEEDLGHSVGLTTVYRMLWRNGWRKVMPRSKHPKKASEEEIASFKKNQ